MSKDINEVIAEALAALKELKSQGYVNPESPNRVVERLAEAAGEYPILNLAVELCCEMYRTTREQAIKDGKSASVATEAAKLAYNGIMPKLSGADNVRDFIACVGHGMAISIIPSSEGTRLLYAAQVAFSALPSPKRRKKRCKMSQMHAASTTPTPSISNT
jgi:hypothetical protein